MTYNNLTVGGSETVGHLICNIENRLKRWDTHIAYLQVLSAVLTFTLAMLLHPEVQRKAQRELDDIVGPLRFPEFSYQSSMPYLAAICKEVSVIDMRLSMLRTHIKSILQVLRWRPVLPLGLTLHCSVSSAIMCLQFVKLSCAPWPRMIYTKDIIYQTDQSLLSTLGTVFDHFPYTVRATNLFTGQCYTTPWCIRIPIDLCRNDF